MHLRVGAAPEDEEEESFHGWVVGADLVHDVHGRAGSSGWRRTR